MTTERQKLFVRVMTSLFQVQQSVADLFFKNRLGEEIEQMIDKHIRHQSQQTREAQHEYILSLKDTEKVLQEIAYLGKGDATQLALSREQILHYSYSFIQEIRTIKQTPIEADIVVKPAEPASRPLVSSVPVIRKSIRGKGKLTETQEKILEFVRREPDCRTKDVVNQFSALSQRTIKRGLKGLSEEGRIVKKVDGAAVYYSVV